MNVSQIITETTAEVPVQLFKVSIVKLASSDPEQIGSASVTFKTVMKIT